MFNRLVLVPAAVLMLYPGLRTATAQTQPPNIPVSAIDLDGNGQIDPWELAAMGRPPVSGKPATPVPADVSSFVNRWNWAVEHPQTPPPPTPTGACCSGTTCAVTTQIGCAGAGGTYKGDGTACTPNPCQPAPAPSTGWTDLTPPAGAIVYYVAANGNDSAAGTTQAAPFRTVSRGLSVARDGSADQVLLRKGDTFNETISLTKTGESASKRLVIGSYGSFPNPRPVITSSGYVVQRFGGGSRGNIILAGLDLRPTAGNEYNDPGIIWVGGPSFSGKSILIEDCKFARFFRGMELQDCESVVVRRCVFEDICSRSGSGFSPMAVYIGLTRGILVEENYIVNKAFTVVRAPYQQDSQTYLQDENEGSIIVRRNIYTSKGTQGPLGIAVRSNATIADNFLDGMHTGIHVGGQDTPPSGKYPNGTHYAVTGNVVTRLVNMTNAAGGERGIGIQYAYFDTTGTLIADNIISHKAVAGDGTGLNSDPAHYGPTRNATIRNNILYNANGIQFQGGGSGGNTITGNVIQNPAAASSENALVNPFATNVGTWSGNTYHSVRAAGTWFQVNYANRTDAQWKATEPTAIIAPVNYPNPTRTLNSYATTVGVAGNWDGAAGAMLAQSKDNWQANWTIDALLGYFRGGFGR